MYYFLVVNNDTGNIIRYAEGNIFEQNIFSNEVLINITEREYFILKACDGKLDIAERITTKLKNKISKCLLRKKN